MNISQFLQSLNMSKKYYLNVARQYAQNHGYDPNKLHLSKDNKHKFVYQVDNKNIKFGSNENLDYIILNFLASIDELTTDVADSRRHQYLKRSEGIKGEWKNNKYSRNNLARKIIWNE
jgi:hypothetical protein